jgi:hypothetical protein
MPDLPKNLTLLQNVPNYISLFNCSFLMRSYLLRFIWSALLFGKEPFQFGVRP